ncbi:hypothetical protein DEO72_LG11g1166 [Vigna unguiculata]|uniref:Uncharacterized protein n=1 Tax=Vigna unguiculata TaxID=3917 RepID=A0A4D6NLE8_VIGUN|nr:hypothetical protein DEO72_LG11g1166 [Vigna unguiculata]
MKNPNFSSNPSRHHAGSRRRSSWSTPFLQKICVASNNTIRGHHYHPFKLLHLRILHAIATTNLHEEHLLAGNTTAAIDGKRTTVRAPTTTAIAPNAVNLHHSPSPHELQHTFIISFTHKQFKPSFTIFAHLHKSENTTRLHNFTNASKSHLQQQHLHLDPWQQHSPSFAAANANPIAAPAPFTHTVVVPPSLHLKSLANAPAAM